MAEAITVAVCVCDATNLLLNGLHHLLNVDRLDTSRTHLSRIPFMSRTHRLVQESQWNRPIGRNRNPVLELTRHENGVSNIENQHANTVRERDFHSPLVGGLVQDRRRTHSLHTSAFATENTIRMGSRVTRERGFEYALRVSEGLQ